MRLHPRARDADDDDGDGDDDGQLMISPAEMLRLE